MTDFFNPQQGLIHVRAELVGPLASGVLQLALDTGATDSAIAAAALAAVGYDPASVPTQVDVITGSGVERVPLVTVAKLTALGRERADFSVLAHTLPAGSSVDGVLGLDFLRAGVLTIDFQAGQITLT
jgi:predicted aspartyl protease